MSLKRQFALEQKVASLQGQLFTVVPTTSVDSESRLASAREELKAPYDTIGKLRAEVQASLDYNRRRASD